MTDDDDERSGDAVVDLTAERASRQPDDPAVAAATERESLLKMCEAWRDELPPHVNPAELDAMERALRGENGLALARMPLPSLAETVRRMLERGAPHEHIVHAVACWEAAMRNPDPDRGVA